MLRVIRSLPEHGCVDNRFFYEGHHAVGLRLFARNTPNDVRFTPKTDIGTHPRDVRFVPIEDIRQGPLSAPKAGSGRAYDCGETQPRVSG
jgi:hypothetical protein